MNWIFQENLKEWQKPGDMQAGGSPLHPVPAHPGASDDSESEGDEESEEVKEVKPKTKPQPQISKPIENLVEDVEEMN